MNIYKMTSDALEEFLAGNEGTMNEVRRALDELDLRRDAALPMYEALLRALEDLEGDVRRQALAAIALMEEPAIFETIVQAKKKKRPDLRLVKTEGTA